jgi:ubiquinone/menaquinone biosynthesis C-methylase UbiE
VSDEPSELEYALPRSTEEYERLARQAVFLRGTTERLFQAAGIGPGMRILDVGSGAGDVSFLAADLVGPSGHVVGIDLDGAAVETARRRAEDLGLGHVTFRQGDVRTAGLEEGFDGVVGRLVLMYLSSPAAVLRHVAAHVRPGGVVVFQELDLHHSPASWSLPETTLWSETGGLLVETFLRAGMQPRMGRRLFAEFVAAGLPIPEMRDEAMVGGGPDFGGYSWLEGLARNIAPVMT